MKRIFSLILSISILLLVTGSAYSGDKSKSNGQHNISYKIMKIKHRAKMGFTNHGRVSYLYTTDEHVGGLPPSEIGTVVVDKNSRLREIYTAVELYEHHHFDHDGDEALNIGTIFNQSDRLNRAETYVKIAQPIKH